MPLAMYVDGKAVGLILLAIIVYAALNEVFGQHNGDEGEDE